MSVTESAINSVADGAAELCIESPARENPGGLVRSGNTTNAVNAAAGETSLLIKLAQIITRETEKVDAYLKENNIPAPSFDADGLADFPHLPDEVQKARQEVVRATTELKELLVGPTEALRWLAWDVSSRRHVK
jgi:hypothetical protein